MLKVNPSIVGIILSTVITAGLAAGCGNKPDSATAGATGVSGATVAAGASADRVVHTPMGDVKVPGTPKSIATLVGPFNDYLIALGLKPAASDSGDKNKFPDYIAKQLEGVKQLGSTWTPNLEAILQVQPDLILSNKGVHEKAYGDLTKIAPTVLFTEPGIEWRKTFMQVGEVVGMKEAAEKRLADFDKKASEAKEKLKDKSGETFMFLRVMPKEIRVYDKKKPVVEQLIHSIGMTPAAGTPDDKALAVSMEKLPEFDPDHIFLLSESEERMNEFKENPLWKNLTAVKKGQVYPVAQEIWVGGAGPLALEQAIDDVLKALVK